MAFTYLIGPIAIAAALAYTYFARAKAMRGAKDGKGMQMFHGYYAGYFSNLAPNEFIMTVWRGLAYTGSQGAASQIAGGVANALAASLTGFRKYTPMVYAALTTEGRVLVAQEHSEMGRRGNFHHVGAWGPGSTAITGPAAVPGHTGPAPMNPALALQGPLELAALVGPDGSHHAMWLSPQGVGIVANDQPISAALPVFPQQLAGIWQASQRPQAA
jgi:hypothetical protein